MSDHSHTKSHGHDGGHEGHYIKIWAILLALLVVSVVGPFVGSALKLHWITLLTAFGIAGGRRFPGFYVLRLDRRQRLLDQIVVQKLTSADASGAVTLDGIVGHTGAGTVNGCGANAPMRALICNSSCFSWKSSIIFSRASCMSPCILACCI